MPVKVVTDSTADLPPQVAEELAITVVPEYLRFGHESYRDVVDISHDEFYRRLESTKIHPTTSQPTPDDFAAVYRQLSQQTREIVSIHVSARLSGTCNSALQGKNIAATGCDISIVDSKALSMGLGLPVLLAARMAKAGVGLQKIVDEVQLAIENTRLYGTLDTLKYLLKGGRIGKTKALLGSVLNVKPVLTIRDGELVPIGNVRSRARGIDKLFELAGTVPGVQELAVVYTTTPDEALGLKNRLHAAYENVQIHLSRLGPALGVHGGPGTLIVVARGSSGSASTVTNLESKIPKIHVPAIHLPKFKLPHR